MKGNQHLQGNVQVYNVRIPEKVTVFLAHRKAPRRELSGLSKLKVLMRLEPYAIKQMRQLHAQLGSAFPFVFLGTPWEGTSKRARKAPFWESAKLPSEAKAVKIPSRIRRPVARDAAFRRRPSGLGDSRRKETKWGMVCLRVNPILIPC